MGAMLIVKSAGGRYTVEARVGDAEALRKSGAAGGAESELIWVSRTTFEGGARARIFGSWERAERIPALAPPGTRAALRELILKGLMAGDPGVHQDALVHLDSGALPEGVLRRLLGAEGAAPAEPIRKTIIGPEADEDLDFDDDEDGEEVFFDEPASPLLRKGGGVEFVRRAYDGWRRAGATNERGRPSSQEELKKAVRELDEMVERMRG
jgi:hypothetical protein